MENASLRSSLFLPSRSYDGVAMAYENFYYWQNWEEYLDAEDESGYAQFRNTGTILLKTRGHDFEKVLRRYREVGVEFEEWDLAELEQKMPLFDQHCFYPPRRPSDPKFWIKPDDDDDLIVVLMEMITDSELEVKGWIAVRDGRRLSYKIGQDVFVPQFHLNDPSVLRARA